MLNIALIISIFQKLRRTLFTNSFNSTISLICIFIVSFVSVKTFEWLIYSANWKVVTSNLTLYAFGSIPANEQWRPAAWIISLLSLSIITLFGPKWKWLRKNLVITWIATIPLGLYLLSGGLGLSPIMSRHWGG